MSTNIRRILIQNASNIVRATRQANIIISSGAKDLYDQRNPHDVINLGVILGMSPAKAKEALTVNPQNALKRAMTRKVFMDTLRVIPKEEFLNENEDAWEALPSNLRT